MEKTKEELDNGSTEESLDSSRYMGANLYIKEKPIKEFKNIDESIYDSHENEGEKEIDDVQVFDDSGYKKVYLGFNTSKRTIVVFCLIVLISITIGFLVTPTITYNGVPTDMSLTKRAAILLYFWAFSLAAYYLAIKPISITFIKSYDGHISVIKQNIFFIKKTYSFDRDQKLSIVGEKGRVFMQGLTLVTFFKPKYKMSLRYEKEGILENIDLSFTMSYSRGSVGRDMGFFKKEQLDKIASSLQVPFIEEQ